MNRFCVGLAIALSLLAVTQARGQNSNPGSFLDDVGKLQGNLARWQQTLNNINLNLLPFDSTQAQRKLLESERTACLTWAAAVSREIATVQSKPTLAGEVRLALDARRFAGAVSALHDSLVAIVTIPLRLRDTPALHGWWVWESEIGSMGTYFDEGPLMRRLDAVGAGAKPAGAKPQQAGGISGHVYGADNGKPLAGARVVLRAIASFGPPLRTAQTGPDGAYTFPEVPPGRYQVGAYLQHSTHGPSGPTNGFGPGWSAVNLDSGQELSGIDMRLHPFVSVTQMNERALVAKFGGERIGLGFGPGRISPDGKFLGFVVRSQQVWVYDMKSRLLTLAIGEPAGVFGRLTIAWVGTTLYAEYTRGVGHRYFARTPKGSKQIPELSAAARAALDSSRARQNGTVNTARFTISAVHQTCYHCTGLNLAARPTGGGKAYVIAGGSWGLGSFAVENHGSLVFFPRFMFPAIAMFDLNTRRAKEAYLPTRAERLLDASPEPGGYLVAYTSLGPCLGYGGRAGVYQPPKAPYNVCFAKIPFVGRKRMAGVRP